DPSKPTRYRLQSLCDLIDSRVRLDADPDSQPTDTWLISPLTSTAPSRQRLLAALLQHTTLDPRTVTVGRININLAPERILNGLPGLSEDVVQQIMIRRETDDFESRATTAWLWAEELVELPEYRKLEPWITGGGDSFRGQLAAFQSGHGPIYRSQIVVGPLSDEVHRLHWSGLRSLGSGFTVQQLRRRDFRD
ncbi:MAG: hypothetical protein ABGZ17_14230, partial [Planctomycetaceae bacterium]